MAFEWVRVGAKCIYTGRNPHQNKSMAKLETNVIYTIRATVEHPIRKEIGLYLEEIVNPVAEHFGLEYAYALSGFRPLISQADDLEMFQTLLNPTPLERLDRLMEIMNEN